MKSNRGCEADGIEVCEKEEIIDPIIHYPYIPENRTLVCRAATLASTETPWRCTVALEQFGTHIVLPT